MNSSGSVLPLFHKQAEAGGPLTVTDLTMTRFFITTDRAVQFILDASNLTNPDGDVFTLEEYEEIGLKTIAQNVVDYYRLFKEKKIEIFETGNRGNEKIKEVLTSTKETPLKTEIDNIYRVEVFIPVNKFNSYLEDLERFCGDYKQVQAVETLNKIAGEL